MQMQKKRDQGKENQNMSSSWKPKKLPWQSNIGISKAKKTISS